MKAIVMTEAGAPDVLVPTRISEPVIADDFQLKVRLKAAGVNPIDTKLRSKGLLYPDALPAVLGCDGAGVVVETGTAVSRFEVGDEVWFCNGGLGGEPGNYAEYTLVDEKVAQPKPPKLSFEQAAAAPLVLITAWGALFDRGNLKAGQDILIHAGAGGVGHVAIQLAKHAGARVFTTVSTPAKAEFAKSLGADGVIFYEDDDFVSHVLRMTNNRGVDMVLDTVGADTFRHSIAAVAYYGELITLLDPGQDMMWNEVRSRNLRIGFEMMLTPMLKDLPEARAHQGEILNRCAELIESGDLTIHVDQRLILEQASEAHRLIEKGQVIGKLVLSIA